MYCLKNKQQRFSVVSGAKLYTQRICLETNKLSIDAGKEMLSEEIDTADPIKFDIP